MAQNMNVVNDLTLKSGLVHSTAPEQGGQNELKLSVCNSTQLGIHVENCGTFPHSSVYLQYTSNPLSKLECYVHPSWGDAVHRQSLRVGGQGLGSPNNGCVLFWKATIHLRGRRGQIMWTLGEEARLWLKLGSIFPMNVGHNNHIRPGWCSNYSRGEQQWLFEYHAALEKQKLTTWNAEITWPA